MIISILKAVAFLGILGLVFGIILSVLYSKLTRLHSKKVKGILDDLPGHNCAGCGHLSCSLYAEALAEEKDEDGKCIAK